MPCGTPIENMIVDMSTVPSIIIVYGAPTELGISLTAYPRRPIEELIKDEKQFSLYVQATGSCFVCLTSKSMHNLHTICCPAYGHQFDRGDVLVSSQWDTWHF
jgi:hypothetical protein